MGAAHRECVRLRGGPVLRAEQAEVRRREQAVEGVQARILALVQLRIAQRRCTALSSEPGSLGMSASSQGVSRPSVCDTNALYFALVSSGH